MISFRLDMATSLTLAAIATASLLQSLPYSNALSSSSVTPVSRQLVELGTLKVSPMGFGTLNLPLDKTEGDQDTIKVVKAAHAAGINLIDTAEAYGFGRSERLTKWAIENAGLKVGQGATDSSTPKDEVAVATKFAPVPWRSGADSVVDACRASNERLGVEACDLYQIHFPDLIQPFKPLGFEKRKDELYWDGLARCYELGLAKNVGVSNYGPTMIRRAHDKLSEMGVPLVSNQINFSLVRYKSSIETVKVCNELGIKVLAYFPLGNGILAGKYDLNDPTTMPKFPKSLTMKKYLKGTAPLLSELRAISAERNKSCAQVSINWILQKGVIPIPGCRNEGHATDNFGALDFSLSEEEVRRLDRASEASEEFSSGGIELV